MTINCSTTRGAQVKKYVWCWSLERTFINESFPSLETWLFRRLFARPLNAIVARLSNERMEFLRLFHGESFCHSTADNFQHLHGRSQPRNLILKHHNYPNRLFRNLCIFYGERHYFRVSGARVGGLVMALSVYLLPDIYRENERFSHNLPPSLHLTEPGTYSVLCVKHNRTRDKMLYFIQFLIAFSCLCL